MRKIDGIFRTCLPEDLLTYCEDKSYIVILRDGGRIIATRSNKHWYGLWRWLRDEEVTGWAFLE